MLTRKGFKKKYYEQKLARMREKRGGVGWAWLNNEKSKLWQPLYLTIALFLLQP